MTGCLPACLELQILSYQTLSARRLPCLYLKWLPRQQNSPSQSHLRGLEPCNHRCQTTHPDLSVNQNHLWKKLLFFFYPSPPTPPLQCPTADKSSNTMTLMQIAKLQESWEWREKKSGGEGAGSRAMAGRRTSSRVLTSLLIRIYRVQGGRSEEGSRKRRHIC